MHGAGFMPPVEYFRNQVVLTQKQVGYVGSFSRDMLEVEQLTDRAFGQMMYRFTTSILSGKTVTEKQRATVKVPAGRWQHLKRTAGDWHTAWLRKPHSAWLLFILPLDLLTIVPRVYLIPWFLRRHPVKYAELTVEVRFTRDMLYPGADVSVPCSQFGAPVMWESMELGPSAPEGVSWQFEDYGPGRFLDRREIMHEVMREPDQSASWGMPYGANPAAVLSVLDWLGQHGVTVDQLVARSAL